MTQKPRVSLIGAFQDLRKLIFGTAAIPMRAEWLQTAFVFGAAAKEELPYGLRSPRNATRGLLSVVQGFILKHLLFARKMGRASTSEYVNSLGDSSFHH